MTKTIKICDKCGKEVGWLYTFPLLSIKGLNIQCNNYVQHELCKECAEDFIEKYDKYTDVGKR